MYHSTFKRIDRGSFQDSAYTIQITDIMPIKKHNNKSPKPRHPYRPMRHTNIAYNRREGPPTAGTGHAHAHHGPSMQPPTDFVTYRTTPRRPGPGARCPNCVALTEPQYSFRTYEYNTMTGYKFNPPAKAPIVQYILSRIPWQENFLNPL